jgi:hypothetical protein
VEVLAVVPGPRHALEQSQRTAAAQLTNTQHGSKHFLAPGCVLMHDGRACVSYMRRPKRY